MDFPNGDNGNEINATPDGADTPSSEGSEYLDSYQTKEYRSMLDIIDRVRDFDIEHELDIPQIVVCGNTSAGKSSVLEAVSHVKFPRGDGICTRYVTEICLRTSNTISIVVTISPRSSQSSSNFSALKSFRETGKSLEELPKMMKAAERAMGLPDNETGNKTFTEHCLRVEAQGPTQPRLTLIDVPGLVQTGSENIRKTIADMTDKYIKNSRSIILAVLGAHDEPVNQPIFRMAREADPLGTRTFGIITKPDKPDHNSGSQRNWIKIAQNLVADFRLKNGWHVLLNRTEAEVQKNTSSQERDLKEKDYFENKMNPWNRVPKRNWGAPALKNNLVHLLVDLLKRESPGLKRDIEDRLEPCYEELTALKASLRSEEESGDLLREKCRIMRNHTLLAVEGKISDGYFELPDNVEDLNDDPRYLRARINEEQDDFHDKIKSKDRSFLYTWNPDELPSPEQMNIFLDRVAVVLKRTRGHESEDVYDPQRLDLLFHKLSRDWQQIAQTLIKQSHTHCEAFLKRLISTVLGKELPHVASRLPKKTVTHLLERRATLALQELTALEEDRKRPTKTRNPAYVEKTLAENAERLHSMLIKALRQSGSPIVNIPSQIRELLDLDSNEKRRLAQASDLLSRLHIYYEIAANVFVDNVVNQVIERHLLRNMQGIFDEILDLERKDTRAWAALLLDPDLETRKENMHRVQERVDYLRKCLDALDEL